MVEFQQMVTDKCLAYSDHYLLALKHGRDTLYDIDTPILSQLGI